jgi:ribosomal protein S18 acetylase RimI-like enzyme
VSPDFPPMKSGQVYRKIQTKNGDFVTLRAIRWDDLYSLIDLANKLVDEREQNPDFGILLDKRRTLENEADYLANKLVSIEKKEEVSVVAEVDGKLIGNSEVTRGKTTDEFHHGKLGIALLRECRDQGIGLEMMKTLVEESRGAGLKTIELEVFANNPKAIHVYEKVGFKQVGRIPKKIFRGERFTDIIVMSIVL